MLSRFSVGVSHLSDLARELAHRSLAEPIPLTVIAPETGDRDGWETMLESAAQQLNDFQDLVEERAEIEAFEARIPDHAGLEGYLTDLRGFSDVEVFIELPWSPAIADSVALFAEEDWVGVKVRMTGTEAAPLPSVGEVATFIQSCVSLDQPFKMTAGLHEALGDADRYGLLNVLGATAFAVAEDLTRKEIERILQDGESSHWGFEKSRLRWQERALEKILLDEARELFVLVGTCSIDKPLAALKALDRPLG